MVTKYKHTSFTIFAPQQVQANLHQIMGCYLFETVVQTQIVPNRILPSSATFLVKWKILSDILINLNKMLRFLSARLDQNTKSEFKPNFASDEHFLPFWFLAPENFPDFLFQSEFPKFSVPISDPSLLRLLTCASVSFFSGAF